MTRQIVLDTETTGLEPAQGHRIIEIACVELANRRFTGNDLHFYINPEREVDAEALKVHGISNGFLLNKPRFSEVYPRIVEYLRGAELIIHNAPFDVGFLNHEFQLIDPDNRPIDTLCRILDTLVMARGMFPGQRNSLDALCKRYSIDNSQRALHGALLDARILAQVYLAMTGGQSSLFEGIAATPSAINTEIRADANTSAKKHWNLPVLNANEEESRQHNLYLALLKKKSGQVIWEE